MFSVLWTLLDVPHAQICEWVCEPPHVQRSCALLRGGDDVNAPGNRSEAAGNRGRGLARGGIIFPGAEAPSAARLLFHGGFDSFIYFFIFWTELSRRVRMFPVSVSPSSV